MNNWIQQFHVSDKLCYDEDGNGMLRSIIFEMKQITVIHSNVVVYLRDR
jgi:hypothetical protein